MPVLCHIVNKHCTLCYAVPLVLTFDSQGSLSVWFLLLHYLQEFMGKCVIYVRTGDTDIDFLLHYFIIFYQPIKKKKKSSFNLFSSNLHFSLMFHPHIILLFHLSYKLIDGKIDRYIWNFNLHNLQNFMLKNPIYKIKIKLLPINFFYIF